MSKYHVHNNYYSISVKNLAQKDTQNTTAETFCRSLVLVIHHNLQFKNKTGILIISNLHNIRSLLFRFSIHPCIFTAY